MADKHTYDVSIDGETYTVESPTPLSDAEAYQYAKSQVPFDLEKQNATSRANMAKQPTEAEMQARAASEQWTTKEMASRAAKGASGLVEGTAAGLAAPALMFYNAVRHPLDTAENVGTAVAGAGIAATNALAHPINTFERAKAAYPGAKDSVLTFASDPTNIGRTAGAVESMILLPPIAKAARRTELGQAVLETAEKTPVLGHAVKRFVPSNATMDKQFQSAMKLKDVKATGDAAHDARMAARNVVPLADASATSPARDAMTVEKRNAYGAEPGQTDDEYVRSLVVPTSEAAASSARSAETLPPSHRLPITETLGSTADETLNPETKDLRDLLIERAGGKANPNAQDFPQPAEKVTPRRVATPVHEQTGIGGRGSEHLSPLLSTEDGPAAVAEISHPGAQDYISREYAANHKHALDLLGDQVRVPEDLQVVDNGGQPITNASGESAASAEALSRQSGMKARGEEFVVKKGNTMRKLVGPDAVDYNPQPGETFGIRDKDGNFRPLSEGEIKHALSGNRKAGSMPIAMRRALFNALNKRSGQ